MLKRVDISNETKSKCLLLLSEICLYKEEFVRSYGLAKQCSELNEAIPSHPSHSMLFGRATLCDKTDDGLTTALKFKRKHPVVVDWLKEVKFPTDESGELDANAMITMMEEITGSSQFKHLLESYNQRKFTIYHLSEFRKTDFNNVLSWHEIYRLKLRIFNGNLATLTSETEKIKDTITVDALTVMLLAKTKLLYLLENFKKVYITSSSIERIQYEYISGLKYGNFAYEAYKAIEKATNTIICPNQPEPSECMKKLCLPNFLYDTLVWSIESEAPFLYADEILLYYLPLMEMKSVAMVSITALLRVHSEQEQASDSRYNLLLSGYQFINFTHVDMYRILSLNNFSLSESDIEPFFRCKSSHDMDSYGIVYSNLLRQLIKDEREECAIDFSKYVFSFLDKTKKRSLHYLHSNRASDEERYCIMHIFILNTLLWFAGVLTCGGSQYSSLIKEYKFNYISCDELESVETKRKKIFNENKALTEKVAETLKK